MAKKCSAKISKFTIDKNAKIRSEKYADGDENSKAQMFFIARTQHYSGFSRPCQWQALRGEFGVASGSENLKARMIFSRPDATYHVAKRYIFKRAKRIVCKK